MRLGEKEQHYVRRENSIDVNTAEPKENEIKIHSACVC